MGGAFLLGEWKVEPALNRVSQGGEVVQLEPRVMEVLAFLASRPGQPTAKRDVIDAVWRTEFVAENTLTSAVADLRRVLGDDARSPRYIETISKRGYRVVAEVVLLEPGPVAVRPSAVVRLKLVSDEQEYPLHPGENVIGRAPEVEIFVDSGKVSRRHARIVVSAGRAVLEDLDSKNGTFLGIERLSGPRELEHGDEIRLGRELMVFRFVVDDGRTQTELTGVGG